MTPLFLNHTSLVTALGAGTRANHLALEAGASGLKPNDFEPAAGLPTWIGRVAGLEDTPLPGEWSPFDCRNNRLARLGLEQDGFREAALQARAKYGPERVAVLLGTTTGGILETELAFRRVAREARPLDIDYGHRQNLFSVTDFVRRYLGLEGPALTISTACSSSAKVFASAARYISAGLCDAAVVGGVDSLCLTTLYGFNALQLLSAEPCRPAAIDRSGISIGEAAGFALLEPAPVGSIALLGYGETSDAYHMSTPDPEGAGAENAMRQALTRASLASEDVGYINLHGTATPVNDTMEDAAIWRVFRGNAVCSSTKGHTGHTLGAAGVVEAIISALALEHGSVPGTRHTRTLDPALRNAVALENRPMTLRFALTNSFGFGGNNCSLLLGRMR